MANADSLSPSDGDYGFNAWWVDEDAGKQDLPLNSIVDLPQLRDYLASSPVAVTLDSLSDALDIGLEAEHLNDILRQDSRFILVPAHGEGSPVILPKTALFNWFVWLNLRLAATKQFSLARDHVTYSLNGRLLPAGNWCEPPAQIMSWGASLHLVREGASDYRCLFPLARVFSFYSSEMSNLAVELFAKLAKAEAWNGSLWATREKSIESAFELFPKRVVEIVRGREGLCETNEARSTLENLGRQYGVTRERIRQLEKGFYNSVILGDLNVANESGRSKNLLEPKMRRQLTANLMSALLCDLLILGDVIEDFQSRNGNRRHFLAKCFGIPVTTTMGRQISGIQAEKLANPSVRIDQRTKGSSEETGNEIAQAIAFLEKEGLGSEIFNDMDVAKPQRLLKTDRVRMVLEKLGRPAHFSDIAEAYNLMWPNDQSSVGTIHGTLDRATNGIVWIGVRGTYALREWGYKQADVGLYPLVSQIVKCKYSETGRPVPFTVIAAEMGKHRKLIKKSSLQFAVSLNPDLRRIGKESYIPASSYENVGKRNAGNARWEEALEEFENEALN